MDIPPNAAEAAQAAAQAAKDVGQGLNAVWVAVAAFFSYAAVAALRKIGIEIRTTKPESSKADAASLARLAEDIGGVGDDLAEFRHEVSERLRIAEQQIAVLMDRGKRPGKGGELQEAPASYNPKA